MFYSCDMAQLPYCCGFYEAGSFREYLDRKTYRDHQEDSPEKLFAKCLDYAEGRPVIFNFVKIALRDPDYDEDHYDDDDEAYTGEFEEHYECESLREIVKKHKNMIDLGTHINPGTHNKIHSYVIKDYL